MTKILITRPMPDVVIEAASALGKVELRNSNTPMSAVELRAALALYDVIMPTLGDQVTAQLLAEFEHPRTRLMANFGVGYNHIDVDACRAKGIAVTNTPGAVTDATADIAMMLILMSCRRASEGERLVRAGQWAGWAPTQMLGQHVSGKTVGIVGMGRIGKAIARRCHHGFGMRVVFVNRSDVSEPGVPAEQLQDLTHLAETADIVVTAVPGGPQTRHLIDAAFFEAMKPSGHFVNIARGDIVDETALISALQSGEIAGAGLDVYEHEPSVPKALRDLEAVTLLPHLGTATSETRVEMGLLAVSNISNFINGTPPPNLL